MSSVTFAGIGSGLDLEALIEASVNAENQPKVASIQKRQSAVNLELSGISQIKSSLSAFNDSLDALKDLANFQNRSTSITQPVDGDVISASASNTATSGNFEIEVVQLAQASRAIQTDALAYNSTSDVVSASGGIITFQAGAKSFDLTVAAGATLADLRTAINESAENFGVTANIINTGGASPLSKLVLTSDETGLGNDLTVTANSAEFDRVTTTAFDSSPGGLAISAENQAQDAIVKIDGIETRSSTNVFENAIQDITITALKEDTNTAQLNVAPDEQGIRDALQNFVNSYNATLDVLIAAENAGAAKTTARSLRTSLINDVSGLVSNAGSFQSIFDIGIEMEEKAKLKIKVSGVNTLDEAFENFDDIGKLFADETDGIARKLAETADLYLKSGGIIGLEEESLNFQNRALVKERSDQEFRIAQFEERLRERFASLDVQIAGLRSQGDSVLAALGNLPGFTRESS